MFELSKNEQRCEQKGELIGRGAITIFETLLSSRVLLTGLGLGFGLLWVRVVVRLGLWLG